jgi:transposase
MQKAPRRKFTAEYKMEAIKLAEAVGVPKAAKQLDIDTKSLYWWIRQAKVGPLKPSGPANLTTEQQRIRELERELAIARMERDLLKKAAAYFAKESR